MTMTPQEQFDSLAEYAKEQDGSWASVTNIITKEGEFDPFDDTPAASAITDLESLAEEAMEAAKELRVRFDMLDGKHNEQGELL